MLQKSLSNKIFWYFFFIIICSTIVLKENIFFHWTKNTDQDLTLIYNALLLNSGLKPEFFDHPGYTQIFILSFYFQFLDFLGILKVSNLDDLKDLNFNLVDFQNLFVAGRLLNIIYFFIASITLKKILDLFFENNNINFLLVGFLILSESFTDSALKIRTELPSLVFFLLALLFFLKFIISEKFQKLSLVLLGFFLTLSIIAKVQIIFLFPLFLIFTHFINETNDQKITVINPLFKKLFISLFCVSVCLIIYFFSEGIFNKLFVSLFFLFFLITIFYISKIKFKKITGSFDILLFLFIGSLITLILFILLKPFSFFTLKVLANFPGWMTMFVVKTDPFEVNEIKNIFLSKKMLEDNFYFFSKYYLNGFELFLLTANCILIPFVFKKKRIFILCIINIILFFILCIIFSKRPTGTYLLYSSLVILINFTILLKNIDINYFIKKIKMFYILITVVLFSYALFEIVQIKKNTNKYEVKIEQFNYYCSDESINNYWSFTRIWHKKFSDGLIRKICVKKI